MNTKIIGLTGQKRCGKGTVASALFPDYVTVTFARPLKNMLKALGLTDAEMEDKETVLPRFGKSPRYLMQTLGTEWGRHTVRDTIWIDMARAAAQEHLDRGVNVVFDDVRFNNEAELVHDLGGEVWHIVRPSLKNVDGHVSEQGVSDHLIDRRIYNTGTAARLVSDARWVAGLRQRGQEPIAV